MKINHRVLIALSVASLSLVQCHRKSIPPGNIQPFSIIGYVHNPSLESIRAINYAQLTHINYSFINPDSLGAFHYNPMLDSLVKRAHNHGVKVMISIGGGSAPHYYRNLLMDSCRGSFINSLGLLVDQYNADGIDVDLEGRLIDTNYEKFVTELKEVIKMKNKLVSAAIATVYGPSFTDKALQQFDYVNIMSYDKTGPWRPERPGPHAPYQMAADDLDYWTSTRKLPKNKLNLGVPFYGYSFGASGARSMSFKNIVQNYPGSENQDQITLPDGSILYYNGIPTIKAKVALARKNANGIMFWQLLQDADGMNSLLKVINDEKDK